MSNSTTQPSIDSVKLPNGRTVQVNRIPSHPNPSFWRTTHVHSDSQETLEIRPTKWERYSNIGQAVFMAPLSVLLIVTAITAQDLSLLTRGVNVLAGLMWLLYFCITVWERGTIRLSAFLPHTILLDRGRGSFQTGVTDGSPLPLTWIAAVQLCCGRARAKKWLLGRTHRFTAYEVNLIVSAVSDSVSKSNDTWRWLIMSHGEEVPARADAAYIADFLQVPLVDHTTWNLEHDTEVPEEWDLTEIEALLDETKVDSL